MTAVAAVQAATADRGNDTTAWRRFGKAVEHRLSLICRYLWGADQHGCRADRAVSATAAGDSAGVPWAGARQTAGGLT